MFISLLAEVVLPLQPALLRIFDLQFTRMQGHAKAKIGDIAIPVILHMVGYGVGLHQRDDAGIVIDAKIGALDHILQRPAGLAAHDPAAAWWLAIAAKGPIQSSVRRRAVQSETNAT